MRRPQILLPIHVLSKRPPDSLHPVQVYRQVRATAGVPCQLPAALALQRPRGRVRVS